MRELPTSLHYAVELLSIIYGITTKEQNKSRPVSLREVVIYNETMALNFLEQIARKLRVAGILKTVRGPGGGYLIGKDFSELSISDLLNADILRHISSKEVPPFKMAKPLEKIHASYIKQFRDTKLLDISGFGKITVRRK